MNALLKFSSLVDRLNEKLGLLANWLVLIACVISAGNALIAARTVAKTQPRIDPTMLSLQGVSRANLHLYPAYNPLSRDEAQEALQLP